MATMQEKMAESLAALKAYQDAHGGNLVIHGADVLGRTHTERLVDAGYLTMVLRGWYIPSFPGSEGDSTVWYVSYWSFVSAYLDSKFDGRWCLSPELSLYYYGGKSAVPRQLIVRSESGTNNIMQLPFGTSILDIKASLPLSSCLCSFDGRPGLLPSECFGSAHLPLNGQGCVPGHCGCYRRRPYHQGWQSCRCSSLHRP